jgi:GT2 family glycosyltransferase
VLAFIDDDAVATPGWLTGVMEVFESCRDVVGVTGPTLPLWENESLKWLPEEFYWIISCVPAGADEPFEVRNAWGNNMSFRREAFEKGGLFLTSLGAKGSGSRGKRQLAGEDTEFSMRARRASGKRIIWSPKAVVYHRANDYRFNSGFIVRRAYREGYTKVCLKKALWRRQPDILAVERRLLMNILCRLLPSTLADLMNRPAHSWRRLKLIVIALTGVAAGYALGTFERADGIQDEACIEYL